MDILEFGNIWRKIDQNGTRVWGGQLDGILTQVCQLLKTERGRGE
jgi:hypothetical protein